MSNQEIYGQKNYNLIMNKFNYVILFLFGILIITIQFYFIDKYIVEKINEIVKFPINNLEIEIYTNKDTYYCNFYYKIILTESGRRIIFDSDLEMKDFISETTANESN